MSTGRSPRTQLMEALAALRGDLLHDDGPQISTMRNYRFAILQYDPKLEFTLRSEVQQLSADLVAGGWSVLSIDLQALLLARIRAQGEAWIAQVEAMEARTAAMDRGRGLNYLKTKIAPLVEGPNGIAADCATLIAAHADAHPQDVERMLVLIGRAGALYPFFRSSALLRHLDGHTRHIPVVLLYPGHREGHTALSFMGVLPPDADYRPRIYP